MLIRKQFKIETAHIVRNCSSERCSKSIHGHSAIIEVLLAGSGLDKGEMIFDFGLFKTTTPSISNFIDMFDHTLLIWAGDDPTVKQKMMELSDRFIITSFNPTAEALALMFVHVIQTLLDSIVMANGEKPILVHSVKYHETATGYAEAFYSDLSSGLFTSLLDTLNLTLSPTLAKGYGEIAFFTHQASADIRVPLAPQTTLTEKHPSYRETINAGLSTKLMTYEELDTDIVKRNAKIIKENFLKDTDLTKVVIYAIPRGGLWYAQRLAHILGIKEVKALNVAAIHIPSSIGYQKCIVVDDILDTGATAKTALRLSSIHFAEDDRLFTSLVYRDHATHLINCMSVLGHCVNTWVVFPWEIE